MNKIRQMKVRKRLTVSFICTVVIASIAGILGTILLVVMDSQYSAALERNGFIQGDLGEYNTYLNKSSALARDVILLTDEAEVAAAKEELAAADEKIEYYLAEVKEKLENEDEQALVNIIEAEYPQYLEKRNEAIALGSQEGYTMFRDEARPHLIEAMSAAEELLSMNIEMGDDVSDSLSMVALIMIIVVMVVILIAISTSMTFANYTAKDFEKPIKLMEGAIKKLAHGELDAEVHIDTDNEFGEMAEHFSTAVVRLRTYVETIEYGLTEVAKGNFAVRPPIEFHGDFVALKEAIEHITNTLSETMRQINEGADQVALGAEQMAESAQTLAEGATNQAGAVQELTATIENVATAAEDNAKKANEANRVAEEFARVAEQGGEEMKLLTEAMDRITATSKEIETIIAEIEDIASQTNLLSLNASIEAARAGEAGRGFAVVADQIGKLASDSAQSAVNTRALISKSLDEITQGNEITLKTAQALEQVTSGIRLLAAESKASSVMSEEQAETMAQVQVGIEQIADVVQNNSASAEETSATSEELAAQSQNLKALIERFELLDKELCV